MNKLSLNDYRNYQYYVDKLYQKELRSDVRFSMITSLTPAIVSDEEIQGFIDRYHTINEFLHISQDLFKQSLVDTSMREIRDLILNEVNSEFALDYHQQLYDNEVSIPYFYRTDESVSGKINEIQFAGSIWGTVQALQLSLKYVQKYIEVPVRTFNKNLIADVVSKSICDMTHNNPLIYHQIDVSSNMIDMNYFISVTRKYGLKYLGYDIEASFKTVNFIRTHSFMELVTGSYFFDFLKRYYNHQLYFATFPSILFFQKIAMLFPFWKKTKHLYSEKIRNMFPFTSLVSNYLELENGEHMSIEMFSNLEPHKRDYYLKYAGADGKINWGSKAVYNLRKTSKRICEELLHIASYGFHHNHYWILQKAWHRKEKITFIKNSTLESKEIYSKYSGFYGPRGFMGGML